MTSEWCQRRASIIIFHRLGLRYRVALNEILAFRSPAPSISFSTAESFRIDRVTGLTDLARKAARWVIDHADEIGESDPELPAGLYNRQADNWRPLFTLATVAGGEWPEKAKSAAIILTGDIEDDSLSTQLLIDVRNVFAEKRLADDDGMRSADLVTELVAMADRPWGECNHGKAITANGLARRLKPFGIRTRDVHTGHGREGTSSFKGYASRFIGATALHK